MHPRHEIAGLLPYLFPLAIAHLFARRPQAKALFERSRAPLFESPGSIAGDGPAAGNAAPLVVMQPTECR